MKIIIKRFESKINKTEHCWIWEGTIGSDGYGQIRVKGVTTRAHRFSYTINKGKIPKGKLVCHSCDTPLCVNPDHLWLGTHRENILDCWKKGRRPSKKGENHHMCKLTDKQIQDIRSRPVYKGSQTILAKEFGVRQNTISRIINYKRRS